EAGLEREKANDDDQRRDRGKDFARAEGEPRHRLREDAHRGAGLEVVVDGRHADRVGDQEREDAKRAVQVRQERELEKLLELRRVLVRGDVAAEGVQHLETDAEQQRACRAQDEEHEQDSPPRELDKRVAGDRAGPVHELGSFSVMKDGMWSRWGWLTSTSRTKTSSRVLPSGTTSLMVPSLKMRPLAMIATSSQTRSTSLRR